MPLTGGVRVRAWKGRKRVRRPGFEQGTSAVRGSGPSHWATLRFVMDLEELVVLRCNGAVFLKLNRNFSTEPGDDGDRTAGDGRGGGQHDDGRGC